MYHGQSIPYKLDFGVGDMGFIVCFCLFWLCLMQSTAMVMSRWSVHLTTLFPGQAWLSGWPVLHAHTFACNWQQPFFNHQKEENDSRNYLHDQSQRKYGTGPGLNSRPLDLQADALPTVLTDPVFGIKIWQICLILCLKLWLFSYLPV